MQKTALQGLRVIDFSRVVAGPYSTMLLGDLGAEVIKVERPGKGDDSRAWGPPSRGEVSTYFLGLNRNKKSIAIDLSTERGPPSPANSSQAPMWSSRASVPE